jgi:hypothetical protein
VPIAWTPGFSSYETTANSRAFAPPLAARHLDLPVDAQNLRHFRLELGIAPLQVVADPRLREGRLFVRLDLARGEYLAHCPLSQLRQARMAGTRPVVAGLRGQQPGGPHLMRVAELGRLRASKRDKPSPRFRRDRRVASRPRAIVERRQRAQFRGALQTRVTVCWQKRGK